MVKSTPKMILFTLFTLGLLAYGGCSLILLCVSDCDLELWFYEKFGKSVRSLKGKVVLITGASSGIGEGIAKALARRGVRLVLTARRQAELDRVKQECLALSKGRLSENDVLVIAMDITDLKCHKPNFEQVISHFGQVDIVVNNAGRSQRALFERTDLAVDRQVFDLNVFAVVNLTRIALHYFNQRGRGHVAVVSSLAGTFGVPYSASYTASKHAIHGYFDALRTEKIGKKIAVTLLCPGPVHTNFLAESFTEKDGEKYGIDAKPTDNRLTAQRCGELCAVALANKTYESWMGPFPSMIFTYCAVYWPNLSNWILRIVGPSRLFKFRDSAEITLEQDKNH